MREPATGEPCAGEPQARFGGRGGLTPFPTPIISRIEHDTVNNLPRFNMPFELGLFLGARRFGAKLQRDKQCLVLEAERYRYQKYLSDIAGQDIRQHDNEPAKAVGAVRDWLAASRLKSAQP